MRTGNNSKFLRIWHEVEKKKIHTDCTSSEDALIKKAKWIPYNKGGKYRKWYGNNEYVVNWENDGYEIKENTRRVYPELGDNLSWKISNEEYFFKSGITWNGVSTGDFCCRLYGSGFIFDSGANGLFPYDNNLQNYFAGLLNTKFANYALKVLNPTINTGSGTVRKVPAIYSEKERQRIDQLVKKLKDISKYDWDLKEISWNFTKSPIIQNISLPIKISINQRYLKIRNDWNILTKTMLNLEEENNQIFNEIYELTQELTPTVSLNDVSISINPNYLYSGNYSDEELESRLLEDTMKEFISYAVGCMFGRYSLDKPGLILANQGETVKDYQHFIGENPTFAPTETNVIPIVEGEWFTDDAVSRFKQFLRVTFGEDNYAENLQFIEDALGKDLEKYFLRDFYKDHVKMYKKRPIYWLFSSPNGSFNALIYMHRYRPDTVSVVLNQYLREYRDKLIAHRRHLDLMTENGNASARDQSRAIKESESIAKILAELKTYEDEVLYPLASERIEIDLDDGVVVNYAKFGEALKKI
jgi:hypothetical protein